jgi:hypothetical protein
VTAMVGQGKPDINGSWWFLALDRAARIDS